MIHHKLLINGNRKQISVVFLAIGIIHIAFKQHSKMSMRQRDRYEQLKIS